MGRALLLLLVLAGCGCGVKPVVVAPANGQSAVVRPRASDPPAHAIVTPRSSSRNIEEEVQHELRAIAEIGDPDGRMEAATRAFIEARGSNDPLSWRKAALLYEAALSQKRETLDALVCAHQAAFARMQIADFRSAIADYEVVASRYWAYLDPDADDDYATRVNVVQVTLDDLAKTHAAMQSTEEASHWWRTAMRDNRFTVAFRLRAARSAFDLALDSDDTEEIREPYRVLIKLAPSLQPELDEAIIQSRSQRGK
jgi:tetratricopeptide (TPR) repeat protein